MIWVEHVPPRSDHWNVAKRLIEQNHYLHRFPDPRTSCELYTVGIGTVNVGYLVFGRPEATRCGNWYGGVDDVEAGRCEATRWQVLNLARVLTHTQDAMVRLAAENSQRSIRYRAQRMQLAMPGMKI